MVGKRGRWLWATPRCNSSWQSIEQANKLLVIPTFASGGAKGVEWNLAGSAVTRTEQKCGMVGVDVDVWVMFEIVLGVLMKDGSGERVRKWLNCSEMRGGSLRWKEQRGKEPLVGIAVPTYSGGTSRLPDLGKGGLDNMMAYFQIRWLTFVVSTQSAIWTKLTQFHLRLWDKSLETHSTSIHWLLPSFKLLRNSSLAENIIFKYLKKIYPWRCLYYAVAPEVSSRSRESRA